MAVQLAATTAMVSLAIMTVGCGGNVGGGVVGTAPSSDGVEIRYQSYGAGTPALVFVHGWSGDRRYWERQVTHFAATHRIVTIDLGGHGESGHNRTDWTIEAFAEDVVAVIRHLDLPQVILVGHSMGSTVVVEAARRIPDRVIGVVAVDSFHDVERSYAAAKKNGLLDRLRSDFPLGTAEFVRNNLFAPSTPPALADWIVSDMIAAPPEVGVGAMENLLEFRVAVAMAQVRAPIHCINSDRHPTNQAAGRKYAISFQVHTMPGSGHFPMLEQPELFNRILDQVIGDI